MDIGLIYATLFFFVLGAIVGSLLNVCITRLPLEKSVLWPGSRCGRCLTRIRAWDNIPLVSYWLLGGRCRACGSPFSFRYFAVELLTALLFVGIFWVEVVLNWQQVPFLEKQPFQLFRGGPPPWPHAVMALHHATLFSLLLAAAACDIARREIPLALTATGTLIGLVLAVCFPWPWPSSPAEALPQPPLLNPGANPWQLPNLQQPIRAGLYLWPVWGPLPDWMYGSWQLGLLTGVVGAAVGAGLLRVVKFLFEKGLGREALGLGDADLMMMAGAFLGWQPVVAAFFVGALVALAIAVPMKLIRPDGDTALPFGPGLALGTLITWLYWYKIGPTFQLFFFEDQYLIFLAVAGGALIFVISYVLSWFRGGERRQ
jgi:leader peptidase (prepilin peptidase) / N-methyltransferase